MTNLFKIFKWWQKMKKKNRRGQIYWSTCKLHIYPQLMGLQVHKKALKTYKSHLQQWNHNLHLTSQVQKVGLLSDLAMMKMTSLAETQLVETILLMNSSLQVGLRIISSLFYLKISRSMKIFTKNCTIKLQKCHTQSSRRVTLLSLLQKCSPLKFN